MKNLRELRTTNPIKIFTDAKVLPPFFETNLVDPARVVKVFQNDPQANIKVFYYQYLKLCFEIETVNYQFYIQKIEELINNETFKFIFFQDDDPELFNDMQFKRLIMDFFGVLSQGACSIEESLSQYPVMDTVFVYFFRTLMILTGRTDVLDAWVDRDQLFEFLSSYFSVEISVHNRCLKFVETDIFVYEEDPKEVYMAYMDYDQDPAKAAPPAQYRTEDEQRSQAQSSQHASSQQASIVNPPPPPANTFTQPPKLNVDPHDPKREATQINQSYIASEFMDYTETNNVSKLSALAKPEIQKLYAEPTGKVQNFNQIINSSMKAAQEIKKSETSIYDLGGKDAMSMNATNSLQSQYFNGGSSKLSYEDSNFSSNRFGGQVVSSTTVQTDKYHPTADRYAPPKQDYSDYSSLKKGSSPPGGFGQVEPPKNEWQPTKDPGFQTNFVSNIIGPFGNGSKYVNSSVNVQYQTSKVQESSYPKPPADIYQRPEINPSQKQVDPYAKGPYVTPPIVDPYQAKPLYGVDPYTTNSSSYQKPIGSKPSSQGGSSYMENVNNYSSYDYPKPSSSVSGRRNVFGLNVSQQFTSDQTISLLIEPHKSSVLTMKQRARAFRNSLSSYSK